MAPNAYGVGWEEIVIERKGNLELEQLPKVKLLADKYNMGLIWRSQHRTYQYKDGKLVDITNDIKNGIINDPVNDDGKYIEMITYIDPDENSIQYHFNLYINGYKIENVPIDNIEKELIQTMGVSGIKYDKFLGLAKFCQDKGIPILKYTTNDSNSIFSYNYDAKTWEATPWQVNRVEDAINSFIGYNEDNGNRFCLVFSKYYYNGWENRIALYYKDKDGILYYTNIEDVGDLEDVIENGEIGRANFRYR